MLSSLLEEFAGKVDLIYIDPPFATGADFSYTVPIGDGTSDVTKLPSMMEEVAYRDIWKEGASSYVEWFAPIAKYLKASLSRAGSLYTHCDPTVSHYLKLLFDHEFGEAQFANEISWRRTASVAKGSQHQAKQWGNNTDNILFFTNGQDHTLVATEDLIDEDEVIRKFPKVTEDGRRYNTATPVFSSKSMGARPNLCFEWRGFRNPHPSGWRLSRERLDEEYAAGRIVIQGTKIERRSFLDDYDGVPVGDNWAESRLNLGSVSHERTGYPTQKPEALLERIIRASSKPGDLVLDCFVGSGTTAAVAEKLGRRWIAVDIGRFAIQTTRKRLLDIPGCRPFEVQNLGHYERKYWQIPGAGGGDSVRHYIQFILELHQARPMTGQHQFLHGVKGNRGVHVGATDAPVTRGEIVSAVQECTEAGFTQLDVLGWEFEMGLNSGLPEITQHQLTNVGVRLLRIPREILDERNVDAGGINFFELSVATAKVNEVDYKSVAVELTDFMPVIDDYMKARLSDNIPSNDFDWIDYWSVDFEYDGDVFVNQWQAYRTRKQRSLALVSDPHEYADDSPKSIVVKIIDIFGNDTTLQLEHTPS